MRGNWHTSFLQWSTHFAIFGIEMRIVTRAGTILAPCKARGLSLAGEFSIGNEKTAKARLAESFVVRLSIRLVRSRHFRARKRRNRLALSDEDRESRCCALAVLSFSLLSRFSAGIFRAGVLTIIFERRRKTGCLQNYTDRGRGEHRRGLHWLETKNENETRSRNCYNSRGGGERGRGAPSCCDSFRGA